MSLSSITVAGVTPSLSILGAFQQFIYDQNVSSFELVNTFVPTITIPSQTNSEFRNNALSGYRWYHVTTDTDTVGSLALQSFESAATTGTDLFAINNEGEISVSTIINVPEPTLSTSAVTKNYVDTLPAAPLTLSGAVTGSGTVGGTISTTLTPITVSQISNFTSSVTAFRLDQFAVPTSDLDINSRKLTNVTTPTLGGDATNKTYVDGKTWTTSVITDYTTATNSLIAAATILPSKISGYPATTGVFLQGDGTWVAPFKAYGYVTMTGNATGTVATAADTYYLISGATTPSISTNFTASTAGRLTYTGTSTINAKISFSCVSTAAGSTAHVVTFAIYKNGAIVSGVGLVSSNGSNSNRNAAFNSIFLSMSTNDYIEVYVAHNIASVTRIITDLNVMAESL